MIDPLVQKAAAKSDPIEVNADHFFTPHQLRPDALAARTHENPDMSIVLNR